MDSKIYDKDVNEITKQEENVLTDETISLTVDQLEDVAGGGFFDKLKDLAKDVWDSIT